MSIVQNRRKRTEIDRMCSEIALDLAGAESRYQALAKSFRSCPSEIAQEDAEWASVVLSYNSALAALAAMKRRVTNGRWTVRQGYGMMNRFRELIGLGLIPSEIGILRSCTAPRGAAAAAEHSSDLAQFVETHRAAAVNPAMRSLSQLRHPSDSLGSLRVRGRQIAAACAVGFLDGLTSTLPSLSALPVNRLTEMFTAAKSMARMEGEVLLMLDADGEAYAFGADAWTVHKVTGRRVKCEQTRKVKLAYIRIASSRISAESRRLESSGLSVRLIRVESASEDCKSKAVMS